MIVPLNATATTIAGRLALAEDGKGNSDRRLNANTRTAGSMKQMKEDKKEKKSINLLRGWPSTSLLPAAALRKASQTALTDPRIWVPGLEYGPDPGYQPLREALARWLGRFYGGAVPAATTTSSASVPIVHDEGRQNQHQEDVRRNGTGNADRITITGGASQSLACILQSFTDPAQTLAIWIVAPCYFLACPIFEDAGFAGRLRGVPEDEQGVDIGFLEREMGALEQQKKSAGKDNCGGGGMRATYKKPDPHRKFYRHVVYCVPSFSNPSGRTTTRDRREDLVDLARRHDALIICDDVYDMLQWNTGSSNSSSPSSSPSPPSASISTSDPMHTALLPRITDIDLSKGPSAHDPEGKHFGHAVSNGSFSKLVAPGTRTGWTYSTPDFALGLSRTGSTRSGGAASQIAATIVCELLLLDGEDRSGGERGGDIGEEQGKGGEAAEGEGVGGGEEGEACELDRHIRHVLLPSYSRRYAILMRAIRATLVPLGLSVTEMSLAEHEGIYGGYFVWMSLPRTGPDRKAWPKARVIADRCRVEDLMIGNGELFDVYGDESMSFEHAIRLCFAWEDEEDLVDGVERLGRVIRRMLDEGPEGWETDRDTGRLDDADQAK